MDNKTYYQADFLIDGSGGPPQRAVLIVVEDGVIRDILPADQADLPEGIKPFAKPGKVVMPGFIDCHVHLMFGDGPRSYEDIVYNDSDGEILIRAARNAYEHLRAGVTMLRDSGASNDIGFSIKKGADSGLFLAPRIHVCGRPITPTGGHFFWCNEEADGVDGVRRASRRLLKQGADFLKIMASGGGGTRNSDMTRPSFSAAEMAAAVEEAHREGKLTQAHCLAAEGTIRAVEAGIDELDHINFLHPDGSRKFDESVAEKIVKRGIFICPTISTGYRRLEELQQKRDLNPAESRQLEENRYKLETKLSFVRRFHEMGAKIVAGTDATPVFGDYAISLELFNRAGLSPMEVICSATSLAAQAVGMQNKIGVIKPGMLADFIYLEGNPLEDVHAFAQVDTVVLNGKVVVNKEAERETPELYRWAAA